MAKSLWKNDKIQFPRLLTEIRAIGLTSTQYGELHESMDLSRDEIDEILERAEKEWQAHKKRLFGSRPSQPWGKPHRFVSFNGRGR